MRYWKVSLLQEGRCARQWHVRAEVLTVGSHGSNLVRLPPPVEAFALRIAALPDPRCCEVGPYTLLLEDETLQRNQLWSEARKRLDRSDAVAYAAPREAPSPLRDTLAAVTLLGFTHLVGGWLVEGRTDELRSSEGRRSVQFERETGAKPRFEAPEVDGPRADLDRAEARSSAAPSGPRLLMGTGGSTLRVAEGARSGGHSGTSWDGALWRPDRENAEPRSNGVAAGSSSRDLYHAPWPEPPVPPH